MSTHITDREAEGPAGGAEGVRVVHVERDEEVAALTEQYLSMAYPGIDLCHVGDALAVAGELDDDVDCVVTDHRPPLTDAAAVAEAVSAADADVPVVVFSAAPDETLDCTADVVAKRSGLDGLDTLVERVVAAVGRTPRD